MMHSDNIERLTKTKILESSIEEEVTENESKVRIILATKDEWEGM